MMKPKMGEMGGYGGLGANNFGSYSGAAAQSDEQKLPSITNRQALGMGGLYKKKDQPDAPKPTGAVGGFPGVNKYGGGQFGLGGYGRNKF